MNIYPNYGTHFKDEKLLYFIYLFKNYLIIFDGCSSNRGANNLKKEDRLSIIRLLLEVSSGNSDYSTTRQDTIKPNIMYNTFSNNLTLKDYWAALTKVGLLEYEINTSTFKTTEKSLRFLEVVSELYQRT